MKKIALVLTILMLLLVVPVTYAHDKDQEREREELRLGIHSENENGDNDGDNNDDDKDNEDNEEENGFEIKGKIESVGKNSFVVGGQTILIDVTQVEKFKQKGILKVGVMVKVEGVVIDGQNYAEEIKIIGEGQGRFILKIKGLFTSFLGPSPSPSPSPSASPEVSPTPTPSGSPSPTASASPSPSASPLGITVKVKAVGPIELVTQFLQQVLAYLEGLL